VFEDQHQRPCGRPTKSGTACRAQFSGPDFACKLHTTAHEKDIADAYRHGMEAGRTQGREWEKSSAKLRIEHLERQVRTLEEKLDAAARRFEVDGCQAVTVDGYGYRWKGPGRTRGRRPGPAAGELRQRDAARPRPLSRHRHRTGHHLYRIAQHDHRARPGSPLTHALPETAELVG